MELLREEDYKPQEKLLCGRYQRCWTYICVFVALTMLISSFAYIIHNLNETQREIRELRTSFVKSRKDNLQGTFGHLKNSPQTALLSGRKAKQVNDEILENDLEILAYQLNTGFDSLLKNATEKFDDLQASIVESNVNVTDLLVNINRDLVDSINSSFDQISKRVDERITELFENLQADQSKNLNVIEDDLLAKLNSSDEKSNNLLNAIEKNVQNMTQESIESLQSISHQIENFSHTSEDNNQESVHLLNNISETLSNQVVTLNKTAEMIKESTTEEGESVIERSQALYPVFKPGVNVWRLAFRGRSEIGKPLWSAFNTPQTTTPPVS